MIDCGKFGNFIFLLCVTTQVLRFVELTSKRSPNVFKVCYTDAAIEAVELNRAEVFRFVLYKLRHSRKRSVIWKVTPIGWSLLTYIDQFIKLFLDDQNLLKCQSRIINANLLASYKNHVLLPSTHLFVKLLMIDAHYRMKHGGVNTILMALHERYWVFRGRHLVKENC